MRPERAPEDVEPGDLTEVPRPREQTGLVGHAEAVHVEFEVPISVEQAAEALRDAPGVQLVDKREDGGYVTPIDAAGEDAVFVSRLRRDPTVPHGLAFWCVSDNLRKGAALNAVQIAELLGNRVLKKG